MKTLDRRSDTPPYRQIANHLREDIEEGTLQPGARLPSERELAEHYNVERATAHRAVQELHIGGYVTAYPGRGVFVREPVTARMLVRNPQPSAADLGYDPAEEVISSGRADLKSGWSAPGPAPPFVTEVMSLEPGTDVPCYSWDMYELDGTFLMSGKTFYHPNLFFAHPELNEDDPNRAFGSYGVIEDDEESALRHEDRVSARIPSPDEVRWMDLDPGIPLLTVVRISTRIQTGEAVEVQQLRLPASRNELSFLV